MITLIVLTLIPTLAPLTSHANPSTPNRKTHDLAALSIQDQSIQKLRGLLKEYRGSREEPALLLRLADLYLERSGITFRISEGKSLHSSTPLYTDSLREAAKAYTVLLGKYPFHTDTPIAHFKRGKAYHELGLLSLARVDDLFLLNQFPDFKYLDSALMDLADDAQASNHHEEALQYLTKIQTLKGSEYLGIAIHKAAWSQFNLGRMKEAIDSLHREITFYRSKKKDQTAADPAFLESAFHDLALFHFECINKHLGSDSVELTLSDFESIDQNGHSFGTSALSFGKMLKAYALISELEELKDRLIHSHPSIPETTEITLLYYQHQFEKRNWNEVSKLNSDLKKLSSKGGLENQAHNRIESLVSGALTDLHQLVIRNKNATARETLIQPLISITESTQGLFGPASAMSLRARYALAETLFELGDYPRASAEYSKLISPGITQALPGAKLDEPSIRLRQISSLYREIKNLSLIPEPFPIVKIKSPVSSIPEGKLKLIQDWVRLQSSVATQPSFALEAAKLQYLYVNHELALQSLLELGLKFKATPEARTALSIVLDTEVESEDWNQVHALATQLIPHPFGSPEFESKIRALAGTSYLKIMASNPDPESTLQMAKSCEKQFKDSVILNECQLRKAHSWLALHDFANAEGALSHLISKETAPQKLKALLLFRSEVRGNQGKTRESILDLERHQMLDHYQDTDLNQRLLEWVWLKGDQKKLTELLSISGICHGKTESLCETYRQLRVLDQGTEKGVNYTVAFKNTLRALPQIRPIWALIALRNPKKLPFQDRLVLLERLGTSWEHLSPTLQIHLATLMIGRVGEALESIRITAPSIAPLTSDAHSIERRLKLMNELDLAFSKVMKMGWTDLKEKGVSELILIHTRLLSDLKRIHTPPEYLKPFETRLSDLGIALKTLEKVEFNEERSDQEPILLSEAVRQSLPESLWAEWKEGVESHQMDYLFHLASSIESKNDSGKRLAPILKGVVLALKGTGAEGLALVESAPDSGLKSQVVTHFIRSKP